MHNPFIFRGYTNAEHFCDRGKELALLVKYVLSNTHVTLISQRRMGKTGLIYRLMDELRQIKSTTKTIYVDILATRNIEELNKALAENILRECHEGSSFGQKFMGFIKNLRPSFSIDQMTGNMQVQLFYQNEGEKTHTLKALLEFLDTQPQPVLLAIDEFQQIREYPEQNVEALLRSILQQMTNLTCIFCGSKKHLMTDIFSNPQRPFYASTQFIGLSNIEYDSYFEYISQKFKDNGMSIDDDAIDLILKWTRRHTYYTQRLAHEVFANTTGHATKDTVYLGCREILQTNEAYFLQYKQFLTNGQWQFMIALAKEEEVEQPYANAFLKKYAIGGSAVARRLLLSLEEKDLIYSEITKERTYYAVSDVFLMRWLSREY